MKKGSYLILLVIIFHTGSLYSNPVVYEPPRASISELYFPSIYDWQMEVELWVPEYYLLNGVIDSIVIQSNAGHARYLGYFLTLHQLFLINKFNLTHMLNFDPDQDTIRIITYLDPLLVSEDTIVVHELIYGYPDCEIPNVMTSTSGIWEQSICTRFSSDGHPNYFYRDESPTLGLSNDIDGSLATVKGFFYDHRDSLISYNSGDYRFCFPVNSEFQSLYGSWYWSPLSVFEFDSTGMYTESVLSRHGEVEMILRGVPYFSDYQVPSLSCESFEYNVMPGGTEFVNIHLTDTSFIVGLNEIPPPIEDDLRIVVAPNPFTSSVKFFFENDCSLAGYEINIFDIRGRLIKEISLSSLSKEMIQLDKSVFGKEGVYIYAVTKDQKLIKTGQLICQ